MTATLREALAQLVALKDGARDAGYHLAKADAWQAARDALAAHPVEQVPGQRWYTPAYTAPTGVICPLGPESVSREYTQADAERLSAEDGGQNEIFVATRLVLPWERAS